MEDDEEDSFPGPVGDGGDLIDVLLHGAWHVLPMLALSHSISVPERQSDEGKGIRNVPRSPLLICT